MTWKGVLLIVCGLLAYYGLGFYDSYVFFRATGH